MSTEASDSVGVVGLGVMGHAIAARLLRELGTLAVHDVRPAAANELVEAGFKFASVLPVDQFKWSAHVEMVGVFERSAARRRTS